MKAVVSMAAAAPVDASRAVASTVAAGNPAESMAGAARGAEAAKTNRSLTKKDVAISSDTI